MSCENRGATITLTKNSKFWQCPYCGSGLFLYDHMINHLNVTEAIPFGFSEEELQEYLENDANSIGFGAIKIQKIFAPVYKCNFQANCLIRYTFEINDSKMSGEKLLKGKFKNYAVFLNSREAACKIYRLDEIDFKKTGQFNPKVLENAPLEVAEPEDCKHILERQVYEELEEESERYVSITERVEKMNILLPFG